MTTNLRAYPTRLWRFVLRFHGTRGADAPLGVRCRVIWGSTHWAPVSYERLRDQIESAAFLEDWKRRT